MIKESLFPLPEPIIAPAPPPTRPEEARVLRPVRGQFEWLPRDLEAAVPEDHVVRTIWQVVERLDLAPLYGQIKAVLDRAGRPTTDPQVLLAVWLLGIVEGVGSARQLARLCAEHDAYRWLCGGVPINYHMLSDFRVAHPAAVDDLLTQVVAVLMAAGAVPAERVAQDGMRVRASAGAASYRGEGGLGACLQAAQRRVEQLARERERPDPGVTRRQRAARERAARERLERVEQALGYLPQVEGTKAVQKQRLSRVRREQVSEPRVSVTDPEARVMKMPDGGFRLAYNVQFATDTASGVIVGVRVTMAGSDAGQALPMAEQVERRTGRRPQDYLMDGGFTARDDITALEERGVTVYAPVRLPKSRPEGERYAPHYGDSPQVVRWRERMATEEGKAIYRQRAASAEWTNAQVRQHGVSQFNVRGVAKITCAALLVALAHNLLRWASLGV